MTRAARRPRRARAADRRRAERRRRCAGQLGEGGRRRVLDRFTWRKTAEGTAEHYYLELEAHAQRDTRDRGVDADRRLRTTRVAARRAPARPRLGRRAARVRSDAPRRARHRARLLRRRPEGRRPRSRARCSPATKSTYDAVGRRRRTATRSTCRSPTTRSTASSCPRCSSTSGTTSARSIEIVRVLRPGGRVAATVPTRWPERVSWALNWRYHDTPGGHVRIYRQHELEDLHRRAPGRRQGRHRGRRRPHQDASPGARRSARTSTGVSPRGPKGSPPRR